jgi:hypothetical protein
LRRHLHPPKAEWSLSLSLALLAGAYPLRWERGNGF